eukprot:m.20096 g.20096  ORF g.20096 m.20096 type:complete len:417 (+) comp5217_c0_seq1:171-1421(+)
MGQKVSGPVDGRGRFASSSSLKLENGNGLRVGNRRNTFSGLSVFKTKKKHRKKDRKQSEQHQLSYGDDGNDNVPVLVTRDDMSIQSNPTHQDIGNIRSSNREHKGIEKDDADSDHEEADPAKDSTRVRSSTFSGSSNLQSRINSFNFNGLGTGKINNTVEHYDEEVIRRRKKTKQNQSGIMWTESTAFVSEEDAEIFPQRPSSFCLFDIDEVNSGEGDETGNSSNSTDNSNADDSLTANDFGFGSEIDNSNHDNINMPTEDSNITSSRSHITPHASTYNKRNNDLGDDEDARDRTIMPVYLKQIDKLVNEAIHSEQDANGSFHHANQSLGTLEEGEGEDIDAFFENLLKDNTNNSSDTNNRISSGNGSDLTYLRTSRNESQGKQDHPGEQQQTGSVALESALRELDILTDLFSSDA